MRAFGVFVAAGVAALALGAWWSWPRPDPRAAARGIELVLVDVSKSTCAPAGPEWSSWARARLVSAARAAASRGDDLAVVAFGRDVRLVFASSDAASQLARFVDPAFDAARALCEDGARDGARDTALCAALELSDSQIGAHARAHVTWLGDGTFTGRDPALAAARLASAGVRVELERAPTEMANVALGSLVVPRAIEAGAPLVVEVPVRIAPGRRDLAHAFVDVTRRDAESVSAPVRVPIDVSAVEREGGASRVHVDLGPARAGVIAIEARAVVTADGSDAIVPDAIPEDDVSVARVRCAGSLTVGLVDAEGTARPLAGLLRGAIAGVDVVPLAPRDVPLALSTLDALITVDAPLEARASTSGTTPDERAREDVARLVAAFVSRGGGWIDMAGWEWIASRARGDGALAASAALVPARAARPPRDVVFLVDASGSMAGAPFDEVRAGLVELLDATLPDDDVCVRFFSDALEPALRAGRSATSDRNAVRAAFVADLARAKEPHGPTRLWSALESIAAEPVADGRERLVLLLTDGQDPDRANAADRARAVKERLRAARVRLVSATPREGADAAFLESLSERTFALAGRGADGRPLWSAVFRRELSRDSVRASPNQRVASAANPGELARPIARATTALPPIDTAVRCELAPGAQAFWVTAGSDGDASVAGEPLAAIVRRGDGLVATLAFAPATQWASGWNDAAVLAPLVRLVARAHAASGETSASRPSAEMSARTSGDELVLEGVPLDLPVPTRARILDPSGGETAIEFTSGARGLDPLTTRSARVPDTFDTSAGFATVIVPLRGGESVEIVFATDRAREFAFEPRRFTPPDDVLAPSNATAARAPDRRAVPALIVGVLLLCAAGATAVLARPRA